MTPENIDKVYDIIMADRQVEVRMLAGSVGISIDYVHCIEKIVRTTDAANAQFRAKTKPHASVCRMFATN